MSCKSPERCKKIADERQKNFIKVRSKAENIYFNIKKRYAADEKDEKNVITLTAHAQKRCVFRAFSETIDIEKVLKNGWVIDYNPGSPTYITIMGYARQNRPMHIILGSDKTVRYWKIVTVYDPRTEEWRWSENYTKKICFCD
jgi:hypothetical protein